jgi:hypothetical protein
VDSKDGVIGGSLSIKAGYIINSTYSRAYPIRALIEKKICNLRCIAERTIIPYKNHTRFWIAYKLAGFTIWINKYGQNQ